MEGGSGSGLASEGLEGDSLGGCVEEMRAAEEGGLGLEMRAAGGCVSVCV